MEAQEEIGEADDRAAALAARAQDRLGQSVIGAMSERIPVNHQQRASCHWLHSPFAPI
jgi:hypothetical protein